MSLATCQNNPERSSLRPFLKPHDETPWQGNPASIMSIFAGNDSSVVMSSTIGAAIIEPSAMRASKTALARALISQYNSGFPRDIPPMPENKEAVRKFISVEVFEYLYGKMAGDLRGTFLDFFLASTCKMEVCSFSQRKSI